MSSQPNPREHLTRTAYLDTLGAFRDAQRVQADLVAAITDKGTLFVDAERLEFLARRALTLIDACIVAEGGKP